MLIAAPHRTERCRGCADRGCAGAAPRQGAPLPTDRDRRRCTAGRPSPHRCTAAPPRAQPGSVPPPRAASCKRRGRRGGPSAGRQGHAQCARGAHVATPTGRCKQGACTVGPRLLPQAASSPPSRARCMLGRANQLLPRLSRLWTLRQRPPSAPPAPHLLVQGPAWRM